MKGSFFRSLAGLVVLVVLLVVAGIAWWLPKRLSSTGASGDASTLARSGAVDERLGCRFLPGQELSYKVRLTTELKLDLARFNLAPDVPVEGPPSSHTLTATLDLEALSSDPREGSVLLARYDKVDEQTTREAGIITAPFLLRVAPSCKLVGFARLDTTKVSQARTQQVIAYELQWVWPKGERTETDSEDSIGRFQARFERSGSGSKTVIRREILAFTELWSRRLARGVGRGSPMKPRRSEMRVEAGAGPWFASLEGHEDMAGLTIMDVKSKISARQVQPSPGAFADLPRDMRRYLWKDLLDTPVPVTARRRRSSAELEQMEKLRKMTLEQVLASYKGMVVENVDVTRRWSLLALFFEVHPDLVKRFAEMLRKNELSDYLEADAYLALGKVPGSEARDALLDINADKSASALDRTRSAFALIDREDVGVDFARTLQADSRTGKTGGARVYASEALLLLGAMAGLRAEIDPEIKNVARETALGLLVAGKGDVTPAPGFGAISDIGNLDLLAEVMPFSHSGNPSVRAEAAKALRCVPVEKTVAVAVDWLRREQSPRVKERIYDSVAQQLAGGKDAPEGPLVAQALADLDAQPNAAIRKSLYRILGPLAHSSPVVQTAFIGQVEQEREADAGLLPMINQYLGSLPRQQDQISP